MFICIYRYIYVDSRNAHDLRRLDGAVFLHLEARLPHPVAVLHGVFEDLRRNQVHLHLRPLGLEALNIPDILCFVCIKDKRYNTRHPISYI